MRFEPDPAAQPRARVQLRDEAANYVRQLMASGQVRPGDRLPVKAIAEAVGVSITPVREALLVLTNEGAVVQEAHRGFRVAPLSRSDIADAYLVHAFVAGELAARAATAVDDAMIAELRELNAAIGEACEMTSDGDDGDDVRARVRELNNQLHAVIYSRADSPRLWSFLEQLSQLGPRRFWVTIPGWIELSRHGHEPIIDALAQRDPVAARAAKEHHLEQAAALLMEHLEELGFWDGESESGDHDGAAITPASA